MPYQSLPLMGSIFVIILTSEEFTVNTYVDNFILLLIVPIGFMSNVLCAFLKIFFFCYFCIYNVPINNNHINNKFLSLNFSFYDKQSQTTSSYFKFGMFCSSLKALQRVRKIKVY